MIGTHPKNGKGARCHRFDAASAFTIPRREEEDYAHLSRRSFSGDGGIFGRFLCTRCLAALVAIVSLFVNTVNGQSYSAQGTITFRYFVSGKTTMEFQHDLSVKVSRTNWLINIDATHSTNGISILYAAGFDGQNIYTVSTVTTNEFTKTPAHNPAAQNAFDNTANVLADGILPGMPTLGASFAWFTFAPDARQKVFVENKGRCIWDDRLLNRHNDIMFPVDIWTTTNDNSDTTTIVWQNDGMVRVQNNAGEVSQTPWPEPYNHGYTNAIFTVTCTNVNGIRIPLSASLTAYLPNYPNNDKTATVKEQQAFDFRLISVTPGCEATNFHPPLPPMTLVADRRLANTHPDFRPFKVVTNGGSWSAIPMETLMANYARYEDMLKKHPLPLAIDTAEHTLRARRQVTIGCMAAVAILVIVLIKRQPKTAPPA